MKERKSEAGTREKEKGKEGGDIKEKERRDERKRKIKEEGTREAEKWRQKREGKKE